MSLYFQLCYEELLCLLGNNVGGERNLHATFHDKSEQFIRPNSSFVWSRVARTSWRCTSRVRGVQINDKEKSLIDRRKRFCPILWTLSIICGLGFDWKIGSHGDEITPPHAPVLRKPILDAQEIMERLPDDWLRTTLRPDHRKFREFFCLLIHSMNACIGYSNIQSTEIKKRAWTS